MFSTFLKKQKPRVYLGKVVVAPREEIKKIDQWGAFNSEDLEEGIRIKLDNIFSLPKTDSRTEINKTDLALEVVILNIQGGEFSGIDIGDLGIPIFWRPKIEIAARLYSIDSGKTQATYRVKQRMPWSQYLSGIISLRGIFRHKPIFGVQELEPLLYRACERLLMHMAKAV